MYVLVCLGGEQAGIMVRHDVKSPKSGLICDPPNFTGAAPVVIID